MCKGYLGICRIQLGCRDIIPTLENHMNLKAQNEMDTAGFIELNREGGTRKIIWYTGMHSVPSFLFNLLVVGSHCRNSYLLSNQSASSPASSTLHSLRVQVPNNNNILAQNLYYKCYYPNPKYLIIGYMDPKP